ncbi:MAG: hypothetical protein ACLU8D_08870 [Enterocloster sp.]
MKYNFDEIIDRSGTSATKMESLPKGCPDVAMPLWVVYMYFACAEPILKALHERIDKKIFGYTMYDTDECLGAVLNWYKNATAGRAEGEPVFLRRHRIRLRRALKPSDKGSEGVVIQRPFIIHLP